MLSEPLPQWLKTSVFDKFSQLEIFDGCSKLKLPNHCLINEYEPGQGIMVSKLSKYKSLCLSIGI